MKKNKITGYLLILLMAGPLTALASGSYQSRLPRPPQKQPSGEHGAKKAVIDQEKYGLGKKVYSGRVSGEATAAANTSAQAEQLKQWANQLPKSKQAQALPSLAGKLSQREMDALGYYLKTRFNLP